MTRVKRFIVLGDAGAGKSAFINAMFNYCYGTRIAEKVFKSEKQSAVKLAIPCKGWTDLVTSSNPSSERDINDQTKSQTMTSNTYSLELNKHVTFELIDTPGFNDTEGISSDESNLEQIEKALRAVPYLNGIIIVANGAMVRLGTYFQHFLCLLHEVCPNSLMNNVCVVLTNCNELSCNLDSAILRQLLNVHDKTIFRIQNNLFRWNRMTHSEKILRNFCQNFEDVIDTIDELVPVLDGFDDVSTDDFNKSSIQQSLIDKSIQEFIECMISLICTYQEQVNAKNGILGAKATMQANKNWEKQCKITAIRWTEVPVSSDDSEVQKMTSTCKSTVGNFISSMISLPRKVISQMGDPDKKRSDLGSKQKETTKRSVNQQARSPKHEEIAKKFPNSCMTCSNHATEQHTVESKIDDDTSTALWNKNSQPTYRAEEIKVHLTLPDNDAISHHEDALKQACTLGNEVENLEKKQETLRHELNSLLEQLAIHVEKIYAINRNADLIQKHNDLLTKFLEKMKATDNALDMKDYFDKTVNILSKTSTTTITEQMETED